MPTPYQVPKSGTTDAKFEGENRNISTSAVEGNNGGDGPVAETSAAVEQPMDPMMEGVQQYNISAEAENNDAPSITKVDEHQVTTRTEALHAAAVATLSSFNPHNPSTSNINNNDITEEPKRKEPPMIFSSLPLHLSSRQCSKFSKELAFERALHVWERTLYW